MTKLERNQEAMKRRQLRKQVLPGNNESGIYLIGNAAFGWFKIGKTKHVLTRFEEIEKSVPFTVEIVTFIPVPTNKLGRVEVAVLKRFANLAVKHEWFVDVTSIEFSLAIKHILKSTNKHLMPS